MTRATYIRISIMMFLYYFAFGTQLPILSLYFTQYIGLSGGESGIILSLGVFGLLIAPIIGSFITDRLLPAERLFSIFQLIAGLLMILLFFQRTFISILITYVLYIMVFNQGTTLTNAIAFHNNPTGKYNFGNLRNWGTIGWVASAFVFSGVFQRLFGLTINYALLLSAGTSIVLSIYVFTMKVNIEHGEKRRESYLPKEALAIFKNPAVIALVFTAFLMRFVDKYYYFGIAPFFKACGVQEDLIMPLMTIAQVLEIVCLTFLGLIINKIGFKRTLLVGAVCQACKFGLLSLSGVVGGNIFVALAGLMFHGVACSLYALAAYVLLDTFTNQKSRAGAHHFFDLICGGGAVLFGNYFSGVAMDKFVVETNILSGYSQFWLVPAIAALLTVLITAFFKDKKSLVKN